MSEETEVFRFKCTGRFCDVSYTTVNPKPIQRCYFCGTEALRVKKREEDGDRPLHTAGR